MSETTYQVEKSYEATTLDYLSPLWYPVGEPTTEKATAEALLAETEAEYAARWKKGSVDPCMFRVREMAPPVPTDYEAIDAEWNARFWSDRARAAERAEAARRETFALKGQRVKVVKGRKVPVGTEGRCFWVGEGQWGWRVGLETDEGETHWTALSNVEAVAVTEEVAA